MHFTLIYSIDHDYSFKTHVYRAYIYDLIFVHTKSQVIFSLSTKGWPSGKSPPRQRT